MAHRAAAGLVVMGGLLTVMSAAAAWGATEVRVKDLARIYGTEGHKLIGYGLVVGLEGTGDSNRVFFTARSLANMLENFGITVRPETLRADNVAAVMATAELPAEAQVGTRVDVLVSSLGDAESLQGGTLLMTPLQGADGEVYAVAQGPVSIGGFNVSAGGSKAQKNHPVVGRVPNGASVVKPISSAVAKKERLSILLHQPDFTTALRIAEAINASLGEGTAKAVNQAAVEVVVPESRRENVVAFVAEVENIRVQPDVPARVVINERTGTVVISGNVRILPVAIAHGGLTVEVRTRWEVSQPPPLVQSRYENVTNIGAQAQSGKEAQGEASRPPGEDKPEDGVSVKTAQGRGQGASSGGAGSQAGEQMNESGARSAQAGAEGQAAPQASTNLVPKEMQRSGGPGRAIDGPTTHQGPGMGVGGQTVVVPQTEISAKEEAGQVRVVPEQATLQDLVRALNALGVTPRDLIAVIQALKELGALEGELIIQ
ncbi:MAG: flagellar basal body P-ring protein FlgI [Armatimonadetes bacterium]|nr:flagellar basal body P-ring protein FlgI [Armatimonadota bacterium]